MKTYKFNQLGKHDRLMLVKAKLVAKKSISSKQHKIGCVIDCGKEYFQGVTVGRTRAIGSTCAERMALDQLYFSKIKYQPKTCYIIGLLDRSSWKKNFICTPCGVCLEMFLEFIVAKKLPDLDFICASWNLNNIILVRLSDLFPQFGKGGWPYTLTGQR